MSHRRRKSTLKLGTIYFALSLQRCSTVARVSRACSWLYAKSSFTRVIFVLSSFNPAIIFNDDSFFSCLLCTTALDLRSIVSIYRLAHRKHLCSENSIIIHCPESQPSLIHTRLTSKFSRCERRIARRSLGLSSGLKFTRYTRNVSDVSCASPPLRALPGELDFSADGNLIRDYPSLSAISLSLSLDLHPYARPRLRLISERSANVSHEKVREQTQTPGFSTASRREDSRSGSRVRARSCRPRQNYPGAK